MMSKNMMIMIIEGKGSKEMIIITEEVKIMNDLRFTLR
jgi:hypothetical protein